MLSVSQEYALVLESNEEYKIDGEEEAVDAIAWMPFEPYEPQESEDK